MFERFTDRARRVVVLAQEEARLLNHNYIGTEHLLLGLIQEGEGVAAMALAQLNLSLDAVRVRVEEIIGEGQAPPMGHIPFTPRAKKVLELSLREAQQLHHNYIGTEHILLGLIREGEGVAAQVLQELGADLNRVRQQVVQLLSGTEISEADEEHASEAVAGGAAIGSAPRVELGPGVPFRRGEGEAERSPTCPRCDTDLTVSARYRLYEVPPGATDPAREPDAESREGEPPAPTRTAAVLYCAECGRIFAADLGDPGR